MENSEFLKKLQDYEKQIIDHATEELVNEAANSCEWKEADSHSKFGTSKSAEDLKADFKKKLRGLLDDTAEVERIKEGMDLIFDQLKIKSGGNSCLKELEKGSQVFLDELCDALDTVPEYIKNAKKRFQVLKKEKEEDNVPLSSLAKHLGISSKTLQTIYEIGSDFYSQGKYQEALNVFQALNHLDYSSHEIWLSLGICFQQLRDYYNAIYAYTMAGITNPSDLLPYLYSCECFLALNNQAQAKGCLELAKYFKNHYHMQEHSERIERLQKQV